MAYSIEQQYPNLIRPLFDDDDTRWQAVQDRNTNADGFFVYCVRTTKIYCRPICKARLARRANVIFHNNGGEAQRAGFRACKRCKPELVGFMPEEDAVRKIRAFVGRNDVQVGGQGGGGVRVLSLSQMARQTGLSKWHFHRVFKRCVGVTPVEYLRMQRMAAKTGLEEFDGGFDFGSMLQHDFDMAGPGAQDHPAASGSSGSGTPLDTQSGESVFSFEDLMFWPEDSPSLSP